MSIWAFTDDTDFKINFGPNCVLNLTLIPEFHYPPKRFQWWTSQSKGWQIYFRLGDNLSVGTQL